MKMDTRVSPDLDSLSRAALEELLLVLDDAVAKQGHFAIALAGGHTPATMYALWANEYRERTPWDRVHLFWGDERFVPSDHPLSNYRMTREALINRVPIPAANVHPIPTDFPRPQQSADAYEAVLRQFFGSGPPEFDLQLLGLGVEGHVASLFPKSSALDEKQRWVAAVRAPAEPPDRLTLTPVVLNRGRNTFLLVAGANKRDILSALRREPESEPSKFPAAQIRPAGPVVWYVDRAAAG
jgi:6-phosphogluconolactonase